MCIFKENGDKAEGIKLYLYTKMCLTCSLFIEEI